MVARRDGDTFAIVMPRIVVGHVPAVVAQVPDRMWPCFLDGTVTVADDHIRVDLALRTYTAVLIEASFPRLSLLAVPWLVGGLRHVRLPPT
ncbi:MAG TPA: hypothetical protein VMW80_11030 [Candidatus Dormibacteraeota bacterium]|nr:hypothetical protein [Candidatus Dormibacteraeota bacterium]